MAKVSFNSKSAAAQLIRELNKVKKSDRLEADICDFVEETVKRRARSGKPLNDIGKFPSLRELTIANRERLAKLNRTHPSFKPGKSNVTLTGQLVDAVTCFFRGRTFQVGIADTIRKPYKISKKKKQKNTPTNSELQGHLLDINKNFAIVTAKGLKKSTILKQLTKLIIKATRRQLSKRR